MLTAVEANQHQDCSECRFMVSAIRSDLFALGEERVG